MNENRKKAATLSARGNALFFACILLSVLCFAFAVTAENTAVLVLGWVGGGVLLVLGAILVFLLSRAASRYAALAKGEEESALAAQKAARDAVGEDGLPAEFCAEIRDYSAPQLRLILEEQKDEYTEAEYAYIEKTLAKKEAQGE